MAANEKPQFMHDGSPAVEIKGAWPDNENTESIANGEARYNIVDKIRCMYYEHLHDYNFPGDILQRAANLIKQNRSDVDMEVAQASCPSFTSRKRTYPKTLLTQKFGRWSIRRMTHRCR